MQEWSRVSLNARCALCGATMRDGDAVLVVSITNLKRKFFYCEECKGPAPPDLPMAGPRQQTTKKMQALKRICVDFAPKLSGRDRQVNERDRT